jgi:hypothetical protein
MTRCKAAILIYQFDWKMPPSKSSLPGKEKTVLIVRLFGAPPVIRLPRRQGGGSAGVPNHLSFGLLKTAQIRGAQGLRSETYLGHTSQRRKAEAQQSR